MTGVAEFKSRSTLVAHPAVVTRLADASTRPWRNGKGSTVDLHFPRSANSSGSSWTLSLARLDRSADFSVIEGYDRHLMVVGPHAVELNIGGRRRNVAYTEVARFAGDAQVRVETKNGPSLALNLMARRSDYRGDLSLQRIHREHVTDPRRLSALVLLSGALTVQDAVLTTLGDTVVFGEHPTVLVGKSAVVARIRLTRSDTESSPL